MRKKHLTKEPTNEVRKIGQLNLEGNIIPTSWYRFIRKDNGKSDISAIIILAEIVYWYRPSEEKDKSTGKLVQKKKFRADKLQKQYRELAEKFGLSVKQVRDAIKRLREKGLIETEFRSIKILGGRVAHNIMYINTIPDEIEKITIPIDELDNLDQGSISEDDESSTQIPEPCIQKDQGMCTKKDIPLSINVETNTNNTTNNTTKITDKITTHNTAQTTKNITSEITYKNTGEITPENQNTHEDFEYDTLVTQESLQSDSLKQESNDLHRDILKFFHEVFKLKWSKYHKEELEWELAEERIIQRFESYEDLDKFKRVVIFTDDDLVKKWSVIDTVMDMRILYDELSDEQENMVLETVRYRDCNQPESETSDNGDKDSLYYNPLAATIMRRYGADYDKH